MLKVLKSYLTPPLQIWLELFLLLATRCELSGWGRVAKVLLIYKGLHRKGLQGADRDTAHPWQEHTRAGNQLLLLTQITLHSLTAQLYFFFPPNDIFSVFFFCASLNKRHTFTLAIGFDETARLCVCVCVFERERQNKQHASCTETPTTAQVQHKTPSSHAVSLSSKHENAVIVS